MEFTLEEIQKFIDVLPNQYMVITCDNNGELALETYSADMPALFGMEDAEFRRYLGTDAVELIIPQDRETVVQAVLRGFRTHQVYEDMYRDVHKTRGYLWVHASYTYPGTLKGKELCLVSISSVNMEKKPYEEILDNSPYAICMIDYETDEILYMNKKCKAIMPIPTENYIGKAAQTAPGFSSVIARVDILDKTCVYYVPEDGRIIDIRGARCRWGIHDSLLVFLSDVTAERKAISDEAASAKEHLDAIMRMNPGAMSTFKINLTKDTLSNGVSGYPNLMKLQEKQCMDGYVEDALAFFPFEAERRRFAGLFSRRNLLKEYTAGHSQVAMKHHYMLTDREPRILNTIVNMVQNKVTGDIEGVVYTLDVTRESYYSRINEHLFDNSHIGIVVINVRNNTFIMPQTSSLLDFPISYEEQDFVSGVRAIVDNYVVEEDKEKYLKCADLSNIVKHLEEEGRYMFSANWIKNGKRLNVRLSCYYVDESHEQIIGVAEDITEITTWEQEQVARYRNALQEVKKANRAKSEFLSSMSHDIRTPLNAILNLSSLLHEELDNPQKLEADIQKIDVAGEFLLQLVNDILDVSAIESGKLTLKPMVYTYATFLNYIKGIIVPLCEDKDVTFVLDEGPTSFDIYMDRVRFHQVFFNILSNAVKFTPPGGTVTFRTTNNVVHDGILTCDFVVTDTGCGMSEEFLSRVFEPFEREDTQNAYVGTGLGLTICKRIVDLMGGTISIESKLGRGTKVTVHMNLLIATEAQKEASQVEMDTSYHRNVTLNETEEGRILVVEDNEINREILTRLLEKKDYIVDCAANGKEAVEKLQSHEGAYYQVILMDIRMPVMNGLEATRLIRQDKDEKKSHIPIIAITANAFDSDARECLDAGMNSYLSKPIVANELYQTLAAYIRTEN